MGRDRPIDQSLWPEDRPRRAFFELLDKIHRANGLTSLSDIAAGMNLGSRSRVSTLLREKLPADEAQARKLVRALGGSPGEIEHGARLYKMIHEEAAAAAAAAPSRPGRSAGAPGAADLEARVHRAVFPLPYVRRDVEDEVGAHLAAGMPVLLAGSSMVGKTRMAATLISDKFPDRLLVLPEGKQELAALGTSSRPPRDAVIFLDDINQLVGVGGITQSGLRKLARRNVVIATIRIRAYDGYRPTSQHRPPEWDVLSAFERVFLRTSLSEREMRKLSQAVDDPDLYQRIVRTGIGEYVGAAEQIAETLITGPSASAIGFALVLGAADWSRGGVSAPVPGRLLAELAAPHLGARHLPALSDGPAYQEALRWAAREINPSVSLLVPEPGGAFSVFDYALDLITDRGEPVPDTTWQILLRNAVPADLISISREAGSAGQPGIAEQALRDCENTGDPDAAPLATLFLGSLLGQRGDTAGALDSYRRAKNSGHRDAAPGADYNLGNLLKLQGETAAAQAAYQRAIESGHPWAGPSAAVNLGNMLAKAGDTTGAKQAYRRAIDLDPDFTEMADTLRAQLAKQDKPVHLVVLDVRSRPPDPEITAVAALRLGDLLSAETGTDAAEAAQQAYQRAARTGSPPVAAKALLSLGYLLAKHGDPDGARNAFDRAIGTADSDVAPKAAVNLGLILTQRRDIGGAREAFQFAIDSSHPEASPVAALFLGTVLAAAGETNGVRNAYKIACASGTAEIAEVASHCMRELPRPAHQQPG